MVNNSDKKFILALRRLKVSFPKIGEYYGLDHSVVMYHCKNPERPVQERTRKGKIPKFELRGEPNPQAISEPIIKEALAIVADPNYLPTLFDKPNLGGKPRVARGKWDRALKKKPIVISAKPPPGKTYADYLTEHKEFTRDEKGFIIKVAVAKPIKINKSTGEWS